MRKLSHWLEELSPEESVDLYRELALSHAREGGASGERIAQLIMGNRKQPSGCLRELCEFEFNYGAEGLTAEMVYHSRQALAFFQKVENLDIGIDREKVALRKFLEAEDLCRLTNDIFRKARRGEFNFSPRVCAVFHAAKRKITRILGDVPLIEELDLHFGPGATRATRRKEASIRRKLAEKLQCSEELSTMIPFILEELPHLVDVHSVLDRTDEDGEEWSLVEVELITSKLSFVPKNAKSFRSICTEPGLNVLVQLGLGRVMDRRLAAFGIDIHDQTVNQRRALEGSLTGALATLDLSSASDTISTELVYELLPLDWACLLDRVRSKKVLLPDGKVIRQEKFSSMGNGFTFPLETLIFWSLAASCCESDAEATAFGDDLIVPTYAYDLLTEVLRCAGFLVNQTKSFHKGPFRESCGKDYFSGTDVRPYYASKWVSGQSLFVLHNYYVRRGDQERARRVMSYIHPALLIFGPDGYGDGHLLGDHPKRKAQKYHDRGYAGYFFDTFVTRSSRDKVALRRGEHVVALYSIYRRSVGDEFLPGDVESRKGVPFFERFRARGLGESCTSPLSLPEGDDDVKNLPLPGVSGYKKISVYTLRG
jgi:hypothetical protein